jgi:hypothetical protein
VHDGVDDNATCHALCVLVAEKFDIHHGTVQPRYDHEPAFEHNH